MYTLGKRRDMQLSKKRLNRNLEKQIRQMLLGVLSEVRTAEQAGEILGDLLTEVEMMAAVKRMAIAIYLDKGRSYEDIKNQLKVSSATIAVVAEQIGNPGYQEVIRRVKADEWATEWSGKIGKGLRKILPG